MSDTVAMRVPDLTDTALLQAVRAACRRHAVRRLDAFGSVLDARFDPAHSDVDLLVSFTELAPADYANAYFGLKADLAAAFARNVDLVSADTMQNPWFRKEVERTRRTLFAA